MKRWQQTEACQSREHCGPCLLEPEFRHKIVCAGLAAGVNFTCPEGWLPGTIPPAVALRRAVARVDRLTGSKCCNKTGATK